MVKTRAEGKMEETMKLFMKDQEERHEKLMQHFSHFFLQQQQTLDRYGTQLADLQKKVSESNHATSSSTTHVNELPNARNGKDTVPGVNQNPFVAEDASYHVHNRSSKLGFPMFSGDNLKSWLIKAEHYFELDETPLNYRVKVAALHLEDLALHWYHSFALNWTHPTPMTWEDFVLGIQSRFGSGEFEDPMAALKELFQQGTVEEYWVDFEYLITLVHLPENQRVSCFLSGLKPEIQYPVRMFQPQTVQHALSLAKLQESTLNANKNPCKTHRTLPNSSTHNPYINHQPITYTPPKALTYTKTPPTNQTQSSNSPNPVLNTTPHTLTNIAPSTTRATRRLTPEELEEKRKKRQCFWCDEPFGPGHRCKQKSLRMMIVEDEEMREEMVEEGYEVPLEEKMSRLTLCAICNKDEPEMMKLHAYHKKRCLGVLIDCGSSLNFLDERVAKRLGCKVEPTTPTRVVLADGTSLLSKGKVRAFPFEVQKHAFVAEVYTLPLNGYDFILGIPWLKQLGKIVWNFNDLTMEFYCDGTTCQLKGLRDSVTVADEKAITRPLIQLKNGYSIDKYALDDDLIKKKDILVVGSDFELPKRVLFFHHARACTTPFGTPFLLHLPYTLGDSQNNRVDQMLSNREESFRVLKFHLRSAQNQMKQMAGHYGSERTKQIGDLVLSKLQPYKQQTFVSYKMYKMDSMYYGLFAVLGKMGGVAYQVDLSSDSTIHPDIHAPGLKGLASIFQESASNLYPLLCKEALELGVIFDYKLIKKGPATNTLEFVKWKEKFNFDTTWRFYMDLTLRFPDSPRWTREIAGEHDVVSYLGFQAHDNFVLGHHLVSVDLSLLVRTNVLEPENIMDRRMVKHGLATNSIELGNWRVKRNCDAIEEFYFALAYRFKEPPLRTRVFEGGEDVVRQIGLRMDEGERTKWTVLEETKSNESCEVKKKICYVNPEVSVMLDAREMGWAAQRRSWARTHFSK